MKAIVILNKQHSLMEDQVRVLEKRFRSFERFNVPAKGWTLDEILAVANKMIAKIRNHEIDVIVIASPIPVLIKALGDLDDEQVLIFHNDNREKKELPNGKIIMTVAQEGWQLV